MRLDFSTQNAKNNHLYPSRSIIFFIDFHYVESKKTSNQRIQKRVFGYVFTAFEGGNRGIHERCMPWYTTNESLWSWMLHACLATWYTHFPRSELVVNVMITYFQTVYKPGNLNTQRKYRKTAAGLRLAIANRLTLTKTPLIEKKRKYRIPSTTSSTSIRLNVLEEVLKSLNLNHKTCLASSSKPYHLIHEPASPFEHTSYMEKTTNPKELTRDLSGWSSRKPCDWALCALKRWSDEDCSDSNAYAPEKRENFRKNTNHNDTNCGWI